MLKIFGWFKKNYVKIKYIFYTKIELFCNNKILLFTAFIAIVSFFGLFSTIQMSDQEVFLKLIKDLIAKGGKYIDEAISFARAMKESMQAKLLQMCREQSALEKEASELYKKAQKTGSIDDVCRVSKLEDETEQISGHVLDDTTFYSMISEELGRLQQFIISQHAPIIIQDEVVSGASVKGDVNVDEIVGRMQELLTQMVDFWTSAHYTGRFERRENRDEKKRTMWIRGKKMRVQESDVRGDGACGWRAYITGAIRVVSGKQLSKDPEQMTEFIFQVKLLLIELVHIIAKKPENGEFINNLFSVPQNGRRKNLETYAAMILAPEYQATNFELRLLCVLFGLANPMLAQVNIIRQTPLFGEIYQSMSGFGRIIPVSNKQINILHVPGHYKSIVHLDEGVLPLIESPDGAIIIN